MEILLIIMFAPLALAAGVGLIQFFCTLVAAPLEILDLIEPPQRDWTSFWWGTAGVLASLMLLVRIFG